MRLSGWSLPVLALAAAALPGQEPARCYVELLGPSRAAVQEPVFFEVVVSWDRAWFERFAVPMSRQPTDVPVYLDVPWLRASDAYIAEVASPRGDAVTLTVAVGGRVVPASRLADVDRGGRAFARARFRGRLLPMRAGAIELAAVTARYAYATEFRDHLLRGREPVDRQEAAASSAPRSLEVRRLRGDAPADFTGAVGEFDVAWLGGGESVPVGQSFEVTMSVAGGEDTNLAQVRAPSVASLDGFHVQAVLERPAEGGRQFSIELVPLRAGLDAVEGLSFVAYAPESDEFVRIVSGPVPVRTTPRRADVALPEGLEELIRQDALARSDGVGALRWLFVALAVAGLALFRFDRGRRRRSRLEAAMTTLRAGLEAGDAAASASAFEALIARVGGGETFASPVSWDSLVERGVARQGVARLKELHAALDQARFGGPPPDAGDVLAAAETLFAAAKG